MTINNYAPSTQIDNHDGGVVNIDNGKAQTLNDIHEERTTNIVADGLCDALKAFFYGDKAEVMSFLQEVRNKKPMDVIGVVHRYVAENKIPERASHRDLWQLMHDNGLYEPSESNWNQRLSQCI